MARFKSAAPHRVRWALSVLLLCASSVGLAMLMVASTSCANEPSVSGEPPAADADMKKVIINVFGMT
tara:strand:- start:6211 stop:6411 length:201 start_codon:yes stop_codon:yes gene_type:complete